MGELGPQLSLQQVAAVPLQVLRGCFYSSPRLDVYVKYMQTYVCIYIYIYVCMFICIHIYIYYLYSGDHELSKRTRSVLGRNLELRFVVRRAELRVEDLRLRA